MFAFDAIDSSAVAHAQWREELQLWELVSVFIATAM